MGSIATTRGDGGQTGLAGGSRVSKSCLRVEAYGNVDELNSALGFARSICEEPELRELTLRVQRELFQVGSALATPPGSAKPQVRVTQEMVDRLTKEVHRICPTSTGSRTCSGWSAQDRARRRRERLATHHDRKGRQPLVAGLVTR